MKILVVHPPYPAKREIIYLPLGLASLCGVSEAQGHEVDVLDMHNLKIPYSVLEKRLRRKHYDVCLMGGFAMQVKAMSFVTKKVKEIQPSCRVILGGVGVSDIPEIALNYTKADAVSIGEAELTLPAFLEAMESDRPLENTEGFVYRKGEDIVKRPRGSVPDNLDEIPLPSYHLFDVDYISRYSYNGRGARSIHIMTSRGCPFRCSFCINSVLNNKNLLEEIHGPLEEDLSKSQRFRDPQKLVAEIQFLRSRYGIEDFHFADEEFITHRRRLEEVCAAIEPLGITWSTSGRADWATEDKLARMKKAGCQYVLFGVESGSQTMLNLMDKNAKRPSVSMGIRAAQKVGMNFIANFMHGHPGETETTVNETVEFCKEHGLIYLPTYVTLFPNSKMFHDFAKKIPDWNRYFERLSQVDFTRALFMNLTELRDKKLIALRNWAVAETFGFALFPELRGRNRRLVTVLLRWGLIVTDRCPNSLRWFLRNIVRYSLEFVWLKGKGGNPKSREQKGSQVPPNELGQKMPEVISDTYEESLEELMTPQKESKITSQKAVILRAKPEESQILRFAQDDAG